MPHRRAEDVLATIGVLRHPCDLDLLLFFQRHPRAMLTSDRIAAYVGYPLDRVERSLDLLSDAGFLERSPHPTDAARMHVLPPPPPGGWLAALLEVGATPHGRRELLHAMTAAWAQLPAEGTAPAVQHIASAGVGDD
jgi:MarR family